MSNCPNCHQPVAPADDICENCGAVLSTISIPAFVAASTSISTAVSSSMPVVSSATFCPNCKAPIGPADDICEQCGMVLGVAAMNTVPTRTSAPTAVTMPPNTPPATVTQNECPRCHKLRIPGKKFCGGCGFNFDVFANGARATTVVAPQADPMASAPQLKVGSLLNNKYKIVKEIGAGGMGAVYLAEDQVLKRQVVIKALLSDNDPALVAQSVKEREFLA